MRSTILNVFSYFVFVVTIFHCSGDTQKLALPGFRLLEKHRLNRGVLEKPLEKRSIHYDYYFGDEEEPQCSDEHQFYHIRGNRCVPFECPGGNQFRDRHNGECLLKTYGVSRTDLGGRPSRVLNRGKSPTKFRLPFGLTLKG